MYFWEVKMADISERIRTLRKKELLTQTQFGELFNVEKTTVSSYERGQSIPNDSIKIAICKHFNVTMDYLVGLSDTPQPAFFIPRLTPHETKVMTAYRDQPDMQPAVDRILGVTMDGYVTVYAAANSESNHKHTITRIPEEKWNEIENEPNTDEDLM